ncbi:HtaA domain-containing protein [Streptomyces sp. NBC_00237]|uniref:HtaA domain-containing protein n=1 Tax=Streptomyces sp. NBC_00237 TaxID=2975687 RepID=UPI002258367F|nr:HtaA domain-containing protein [Streptomyces sp. NBC_00237]MCX5201590.1 HtaA domain-containing protein [Streptomyces sp. NBC_00237]
MLSSRPARASAVALVAAVLGALLPASTASAAARTVQGGRLDWGIKSSFQSYVTGPIAKGTFTLRGGAATVGGSQFRFHSANGSYDPDSGALDSGFSGGVRFTGHQSPAGFALDLTISRPTVRISGGSGTLFADVSSKDKASGKVTRSSQIALASLAVGGINMKGGGSPIALNNVPATLTSQGASAFAGYYTAGTRLDPVSLSADVAAGAKTPEKAPEKAPEAKQPEEKGKGDEKASGPIQDAAVDWGVRRTFREYVTGPISRGTWDLSGGALDGGALFRFPQGKGAYDSGRKTLDARFAGSVRFSGAHLDLTLSQVNVKVADGKGTLVADVASKDPTTKKDVRTAGVPLVTFEAKALDAKDGLVNLTEAPATLTEEGAKAFGSMYKAGTEMDPVSLAVAVDAKAKLPALPDLGSDTKPSAPPAPAASASADKKTSEEPKTAKTASASASSNTVLYVAAGAVVLVLLAGAAFFVVRRRGSGTNAG